MTQPVPGGFPLSIPDQPKPEPGQIVPGSFAVPLVPAGGGGGGASGGLVATASGFQGPNVGLNNGAPTTVVTTSRAVPVAAGQRVILMVGFIAFATTTQGVNYTLQDDLGNTYATFGGQANATGLLVGYPIESSNPVPPGNRTFHLAGQSTTDNTANVANASLVAMVVSD